MKSPWIVTGLASLLFLAIGNVSSHADESVATSERGLSYRMPSGNFVRSTDPRRAVPPARPWDSAIAPAELARIKALPGAAGDNEGTIRKESLAQPEPAAAITKACVTNGAADGLAPAGIAGAVGPSNIVVVTNSNIGVYVRSTCALISRITLKVLFNNFNIPATDSLLGARVIYDQLSARFFLAVVSSNSSNTDQHLYFAASTDDSGTAWNRYRKVLSRGTTQFFCKNTPANAWSFMMLGVNGTRMLVTANQTPTAGVFLTLDKAAMLIAGEVKMKCFRGAYPPSFAPPIVLDQATDAIFVSTGPGSDNKISGVKIATGIKPEKDVLSLLTNINIPSWTAPPDAPQPNGQKLDTLDGRFQSASTQIGNVLWNVHTVNVKGYARWRLYKLSAIGDTPLLTYTPTFGQGAHNFNPSVATGSLGATRPAFVTYSRTVPTTTKGVATIMIASGPNASKIGWAATIVAKSSSQFATNGADSCNASATGACRWGDYSATQMIPGSARKAWGFNELAVGPGDHEWGTSGAQAE